MGMLDYIKQNVGPAWRHMGSPEFAEGYAYLQGRRQGIPAAELLTQMQASRSARERDNIMKRQVALDEAEQRMREDAMTKKQSMLQSQQVAAGILGRMSPQDQAKYAADPANRAWWFSPYADETLSRNVIDPLVPEPTKYEVRETAEGGLTYIPTTPGAPPISTGLSAPDNSALHAIPDPTSPTGYRYAGRAGSVGQPAPGPSGTSISIDPKTGQITLNQGPGITTATRTGLEGQVMSDQEVMQNLDTFQTMYKPEYQTLATQWEMTAAKWKETLGMGVDPATRQTLADYTVYRSYVGRVAADMISKLYGAVLSKNEEARANAFVPKVGTGPFDGGDSPTEIQAKINGLRLLTQQGLARRNYALAHGLSTNPETLEKVEGLTLDMIPHLVRQRGLEIESELRDKGGYTEEQVKAKVREQLQKEFGL